MSDNSLLGNISGDTDVRCISGGCDINPDSHPVHHLPALCHDVVPSLLPGLWQAVDLQEQDGGTVTR